MGWVKGFSMWPNLIPGDILSVEDIPLNEVCPGMIIAFRTENREETVVHRVRTVRNYRGRVCVGTCGDSSGKDSSFLLDSGERTVKSVRGVLRRGRYRAPGSAKLPETGFWLLVRRLHCSIVRRLFW